MKIPSQLSSLLQKNDKLNGAVLQAISIVRPWFEDNKLVFFPEYTDHGPKHIQEVFETTESLIRETAWPLLRSEDAATLILGTILHDCAMHLSEDGFISLISDRSRPLNEGFHDKPWPQLWDEFMAEARRFDERKLRALFDDDEPVRTPLLDPLTMSKRDRLLVGEFLRRHHPRLAHEIALFGVPGPANTRLSLGDISDHIKDLAGLIARSHGLDLRISVDYLNEKSKWGARRTLGIHVTYLMVLVRIADYLQIHSGRAPHEVLQVRSLRSPVSRGEWNVHHVIKDIHQETDDPEALWVEGQPEDVQTYLKLKYLLSDIQREMDDSWAVLGEVYGPKEDLRGFGIRLRRIKSNLHHPSFAKTVTYVPCQAALDTAGVDLLKLLITPLYGDRPEIGIRELLQNAIDACRELKDYLDKNPQLRDVELQEQSADVVIDLHEKKDGTKWITVSDRGIGMSVDTILNYFLKAGASFRNSFTWRRQHEDEHGRSQVLRSGRFGIGVLAGFLLGSQIHVSTRHVTAKTHEGIRFTCSFEDEHIQLNRSRMPIGTTVSIQIPESTYNELGGGTAHRVNTIRDWDWYCLEEPSVCRLISTGPLRQQCVLPAVNSALPLDWRRIEHSDYQDIHWSYSHFVPQLACNGIAVESPNRQSFDHRAYEEAFEDYGLFCPKLSIFDSKGSLPLNLQRTALSVNHLPFEDALINDICFDVLAFLLVYTPHERPTYPSAPRDDPYRHPRQFLDHPAIHEYFWHYYSNEGIALLDLWNIQRLKTRILSVFSNPLLLNVFGKNSFHPYVDGVRPSDLSYVVDGGRIGELWLENYRLICNEHLLEIQPTLKNSLLRYLEMATDDWRVLRNGRCPPLELDLEAEPFRLCADRPNFLLVVYPSQMKRRVKPRLLEAWYKIIRQPYIPYDTAERSKQLASAYKRLAAYIGPWKEFKNQESMS